MEHHTDPAVTDAEHGRPRVQPRAQDRCWQLISLMCLLALGTATTLLVLAHRNNKKESSIKDPHAHAHSEASYLLASRHEASSPEKPAAHLQGITEKNGRSVKWSNSTSHAFTRGHVQLQNNSLVIPSTGMYFVYAQVVFSGSSCPEAGSLYISHNIMRFSKSYPEPSPLMSAQKTTCVDATPAHGKRPTSRWFRTIYQGAVFRLDKGDQLSTKMEHQFSNLVVSYDSTYFGLFAV
ncbi:lymphotoxin-alpha-like [Lissotriton helveticus]